MLCLKTVINNRLHSIYVFTVSFIYPKMFIMSLHYTLQVTHFKRGKISLGSFLESPKYNRLRNVVFFPPYPDLVFFSVLISCCFHFKTTCHIIYFQSVHQKSNGLKEEKKKTLRLCLFLFAQPQFYFLKSRERAAAEKEKSFEILIFFG